MTQSAKLDASWMQHIGIEFEQPYMKALKEFLQAEKEADKAAGRVKHIFLRVGNVLVQCAESKDGKVALDKNNPNVSPHWAFTVSAVDLDRNIARLRKLGIPCTDPIQHRGLDVTSAYFQSPEGHKFEICTWEPYPEHKAKHMRIDWPSLAHDWPHGK